jgi:hypothetical protein
MLLGLRTANDDGDNMLASIEEEEFANDEGLDQHDRTRRDDCQQTDYVEDSDDVEDDDPPKNLMSNKYGMIQKL